MLNSLLSCLILYFLLFINGPMLVYLLFPISQLFIISLKFFYFSEMQFNYSTETEEHVLTREKCVLREPLGGPLVWNIFFKFHFRKLNS